MKKGFTLIELIFVIVILGILGAVALPKFADTTGKAKQASDRSLFASLGKASITNLEFAKLENTYPNYHSEQELATAPNANGSDLNDRYKQKGFLSGVLDDTREITVVGVVDLTKDGVKNSGGTLLKERNYDLIFLRGPAAGVDPVTEDNEPDGQPDSNDFWILNTNNIDLTVVYSVDGTNANDLNVTVRAGGIALIDVKKGANAGDTDKFKTKVIKGIYKGSPISSAIISTVSNDGTVSGT